MLSYLIAGNIQAQYLYKRFNNNYDYIFTSPLKRASQTAEVIASNKQIKPILINELREINFGEWEGLTLKEISANFPKEFYNWRNDKLGAPMWGGDLSLKNACVRAKESIIKIADTHKEKKIIIVAHGGIIKAGLIGIFQWDITMYHKINLGNTAICELNFDHSLNPTLVKLNDTSHLPDNYIISSYV